MNTSILCDVPAADTYLWGCTCCIHLPEVVYLIHTLTWGDVSAVEDEPNRTPTKEAECSDGWHQE